MNKTDIPKPFIEHLEELRSRFFFYLITLIITSAISFYFSGFIIDLLIKPLHQPLYYTSPAGGLDFLIKIALFSGFLLSIPMLVFQITLFASPALPRFKTYQLLLLLFCSFCLLTLGVSFAYFISLPSALYFLASIGSDKIQSLITAQEYISFVSRYLGGFGLFFQLPLILFIINSFHQLSTRLLLKFQRWVIIFSFILSAILTPTPDFINQSLMALPLILLYYLSIGLIHFINNRKGHHN